MLESQHDEGSGTLWVHFGEGLPPSRAEVDEFLLQLSPLLRAGTVRSVSVNGARVNRLRSQTVDDVASPVRYEAARRRGLDSWPPQGKVRKRRALEAEK